MTTQPLMGLVSRTLTDQDKVKEKNISFIFFRPLTLLLKHLTVVLTTVFIETYRFIKTFQL